MRYWKLKDPRGITEMSGNNIFVFGSNPEGRHGMGAAKAAMKFGAKLGIGRGLQGNTYALPTKNLKAGFTEKCTGITYHRSGKRSIPLSMIRDNILELYSVARSRPELTFVVVYQADASNLNGYSSNEIMDTFIIGMDVPNNILIHESFRSRYDG
ncbi:hypothetical protein vBVpaPMGD2_1 [Vibrio phage vB_VpaP_MGD2]|uniref:Uncharacterized protein n=1 Tax=Vibrio phage vB_VpaP_MGD2 TaxID=2565877 RepID=A0A6B7HX86_9CAUD|nr:hypothetical protein vBVpaPMGD2_1 [Vibrio phage vB_VpaP_MGD2]